TGATIPEITALQTGKFIATVTNAYGCSSLDTINIVLKSVPEVDLGADKEACAGEELDAGAGAAFYEWNSGDNSQIITTPLSGNYIVTVTGWNGCTNSDTVTV